MTTFPTLPDADKIAAMEARAKTEAEQCGQTTVPAMLLQGAAWGAEVARLRAALFLADTGCNFLRFYPALAKAPLRDAKKQALAALEGPK